MGGKWKIPALSSLQAMERPNPQRHMGGRWWEGLSPTVSTAPNSRVPSPGCQGSAGTGGYSPSGFDVALISDSRKGKLDFHLSVQRGEKKSTASPSYSFAYSFQGPADAFGTTSQGGAASLAAVIVGSEPGNLRSHSERSRCWPVSLLFDPRSLVLTEASSSVLLEAIDNRVSA